ncbi:hypothetical protein D9613_011237 [Agrocybe pediades]|uniref:Heterokaryon incompatibility domain-containing protein n=1 Tax=Agrocybe pediades TaxID=84607 RepID=A0A8H4VMG2_9AGAR|nr:hypothetical protein D9613_011237 [Agrocybe pediades]
MRSSSAPPDLQSPQRTTNPVSEAQFVSTSPSPSQQVISFALDDIFDYPTIHDRGHNLISQITDAYGAFGLGGSDQYTLLLDGTHLMIQKSISDTCRTQLALPLPIATSSDVNTPPNHDLTFMKCRRCAGSFVFDLGEGSGCVNVVAGVPDAGRGPYKTLSYVWGVLPEAPLTIPCANCGNVTSVPILSPQRFRNLMHLGGAGNTVWLDALSIDQQDPQEVAKCVAVMGHIYKNATCVSVLLSESDKPAYDLMKSLELESGLILSRLSNFINNSDYEVDDPTTGQHTKVLTSVCQDFVHNITTLYENLNRFVYFSRAWTFQEWALANDVEVALEGGGDGRTSAGADENLPPSMVGRTCQNLKSLALGAAMLISRYKMSQHQYAEIKLGEGLTRGKIPGLFNIVKSLFPDEDLFLSYEEIDPKKASFQTNFPHAGVDHALGVRSLPPPSRNRPSESSHHQIDNAIPIRQNADPAQQTRARLTLLLSVFASSKRQAKYEADLVACWASMCNIKYAYSPHDTFAVALRKVKKELRNQGIKIFEFLPTEYIQMSGLVNDADRFLLYAKEHSQLNATNEATFPGAPLFTGHADTVSHMIYSITNIRLPTEWISTTYDDGATGLAQTTYRVVAGASVHAVIPLDSENLGEIATQFAKGAVYGDAIPMPGLMFWPVQDVVKAYLEEIPAGVRAWSRVVIVKIPFHKRSSNASPTTNSAPTATSVDLHMWAVIPADIPVSKIKVCREPINESLALVLDRGTPHPGGSNFMGVVAFLTLSDHLSGTFLVTCDEAGLIDLTLKIPERGDAMSSHHHQIAIRKLCGEIKLEKL